MRRPMPIRRYGAHVLLQLLLPDIADSHSYPDAHTHANAYADAQSHAIMPLRHVVHRPAHMHPIRRDVFIVMPVRMLLPDATHPYSHSDPYAYPYPYAVVYWVARLR